MVDADLDTGEARIAIGTIAHDHIDFDREQQSAPRLQRFGVLKEAKRQPDFPGGGLSQVNDRVALVALATVWESTRALATDDHARSPPSAP